MSTWRLRELVGDDVQWIFDACQDPQIQKWTQVPRPYILDHAMSFVFDPPNEFRRRVIEIDGAPAGMISVHEVDPVSSCASIGYWVRPDYRGRGGVVAAIDALWSEISGTATSMKAYVAEENAASRRALVKAGFECTSVQFGPAVDNLVEVPTCVYER